jgi:prepilin-type N-terminal cleavage/methylation domain-containing protein
MVISTGRRLGEAGQGFTLIELLLTTVLVLLLVGAVVFNFSALQRGQQLEEGAAQVEALLRFARAQAASTGRQVQINFEEEVAEGISLSLGGIRVLHQTDPVGDPGTWTELPEAASFVQGIADLVEVRSVRWIEPSAAGLADSEDISGPNVGELGEELPDVFPPITFYPDGSSDSAEIVLRSRDADDARRVAVRIVGLTGMIRREWIVEDEGDATEPESEKAAPGRSAAQSGTVTEPRRSDPVNSDSLPASK